MAARQHPCYLRNLPAAVLMCLLLAACTTLGPDYEAPPTPELPSDWAAEETETESTRIAEWWRLFEDPVLDELIARGASENLSIEAAGLRIVQARAALGISDALVFPQQQQINGNFAALYRNEDWFNSANASFDVGWEMDIWGKYARGIESAEASLYASIASYHDVLVTISAEIARNYINYRTAEERIFLSRQNSAIQRRVVEMTQVQHDAGNVSELDVQQAKTQLYATESALPSLNITRIQARNALAVLLGTIPEEVAPLLDRGPQPDIPDFAHSSKGVQRREAGISPGSGSYSVIPAPPELAPEIDPQLVLRRPDLKVAEMRTRAQSARIGLTEADLYPQFFLIGSGGFSQTVESGDNFSASDALTANIGPGLSWNIFNYDRIKNQVRIEDALFQESLTNYNQSILAAVQEVTNALEGYRYTMEKSRFDALGVEASIRAFNISANQYNNGLVNYQRLLSTVEKMTLREDVYAQTRGSIANSVVALYKALGGGWEPLSKRPIVKPGTVEQMRNRTDWGDYLEPGTIIGEDRNE